MSKFMTEKELLDRLAALPRGIAPPRDAWPSIASRLDEGNSSTVAQGSQNHWWQWVAASVFLAFTVGLFLGHEWVAAPGQTETGLAQERQFTGEGGLSATLAATELEYQAAFREFISVGESRENLAPRTVEKLVTSWADLRAMEADLTVALHDHPDSIFLNTKMLQLRSRQLDFLRQIALLDRNSRRTMI